MNSPHNADVAHTILAQLGDNRFLAMTGARGLLSDTRSLSFKLPRFAGSRINHVRIVLDESDTYTVSFWKVRGATFETIAEQSGVYADNLRAVFERATGLRVSL